MDELRSTARRQQGAQRARRKQGAQRVRDMRCGLSGLLLTPRPAQRDARGVSEGTGRSMWLPCVAGARHLALAQENRTQDVCSTYGTEACAMGMRRF